MTMMQDIEAFAAGKKTAEETVQAWADSGVLNMPSWQNKDRTPAQVYLDVEDRDWDAEGWPQVSSAFFQGVITEDQYMALWNAVLPLTKRPA